MKEEQGMRVTGNIVSWSQEKGYGFVKATVGGREVFIHIKDLQNTEKRLSIGLGVSYIQTTDKQGRACASFVAVDGDSVIKRPIFGIWVKLVLSIFLFLLIVLFVWLQTFEGTVSFQVWVVRLESFFSP